MDSVKRHRDRRPSRLGEVQLVTCYIERILSMASIEPGKKNLYFL